MTVPPTRPLDLRPHGDQVAGLSPKSQLGDRLEDQPVGVSGEVLRPHLLENIVGGSPGEDVTKNFTLLVIRGRELPLHWGAASRHSGPMKPQAKYNASSGSRE